MDWDWPVLLLKQPGLGISLLCLQLGKASNWRFFAHWAATLQCACHRHPARARLGSRVWLSSVPHPQRRNRNRCRPSGSVLAAHDRPGEPPKRCRALSRLSDITASSFLLVSVGNFVVFRRIQPSHSPAESIESKRASGSARPEEPPDLQFDPGSRTWELKAKNS